MQAVILAAGQGKRLRPLTLTRSKAMLPVAGKPMIARVIEAIAAQGITDFIVVHNPSDGLLPVYFLEHPIPSIKLRWVEQSDPRGMADALKQAEPFIEEPFVLSACDSLIPRPDYAALLASWHNPPQPTAVLALLTIPPSQAGSTALVSLKNGWVRQIIEKPPPSQVISNIASLPIYIFSPTIFPHLQNIKPSARGELELQDAIQSLINEVGKVRGAMVTTRWNLTTAADLLQINLSFLRLEAPETLIQPVLIAGSTHLVPPFYIGPHTRIAEGCTIGPHVYIESAATLGKGCRVSNSVLLHGATIQAGQILDSTLLS